MKNGFLILLWCLLLALIVKIENGGAREFDRVVCEWIVKIF